MTKPVKRAKPHTKGGTGQPGAAERRKRFVEAYLSNGENITQAALAAGFSPKSAAQQGSRLLKDEKIQQLIHSRHAEVLEKAKLSTERVIQNLADALFFDPRRLINQDGTAKALHELDEATAQCITGFEVIEEYRGRGTARKLVSTLKKVKWLDKNVARDQALKHLGQYLKNNAQLPPPPPAGPTHVTVQLDFEAVRKKMAGGK